MNTPTPTTAERKVAEVIVNAIVSDFEQQLDWRAELMITRILIAHRQPANLALQNVCQQLIDYRDHVGPLNFQLEKADDFINQMRVVLDAEHKQVKSKSI